MIRIGINRQINQRSVNSIIVVVVLMVALFLGQRASYSYLVLLVAGLAGLILLSRPVFGIFLIIVAALVLPLDIGTGTEVSLNLAALMVPAMLFLWLLDLLRRQEFEAVNSSTFRPLILFLIAGLLSLLIGYVTWDNFVPRSANFILVQLAQWAIFAFSVGAFFLMANLALEEKWLQYITWTFLILGGMIAILQAIPFSTNLIGQIFTIAIIRAPFWILLASMVGGQLLFNEQLKGGQRLILLIILTAIFIYTFEAQREAASNWVGIVAVGSCLVWLRWPRMRWLALSVVLLLLVLGILFPAVWDFAGGDSEWFESGGSRLALISRVVEDTMRNPITGLGPAAYRLYGATRPLVYEHIIWMAPRISSHNNYIDLFSQVGIVGLALFFWFVFELGKLGRRLNHHFRHGFAAGYVNGMIGAGVGALTLMMLADWILPFVYNIGFPGFQASVLVWLFLGGLITLEQIMLKQSI